MPAPTYAVRPWGLTVWFALFVVLVYVVVTSTGDAEAQGPLESLLPGFSTHVSNLVISGALMLAYGLIRVLYGARFRELLAFALILVAANYIYEGALTLWNTKDLVDGHYGAASTLLVLAFLAAVQRFGLAPVKP